MPAHRPAATHGLLGREHPGDREEPPLSEGRWLQALAAIASLAGIGISVYLTAVHYSTVPLVCTTSGAINCEVVLSSPYSVIAGSNVPTSAAGIVWFAGSAVLAVAMLTGRGSRLVPRLQLAWSALGLATVVYLVFIEIVFLGAICIWCTASHVLVVAIFMMVLWRMGARVNA